MQELIEHIQVNATKFSLMNTYNILKEIEPYLEKEKEQIQEWYAKGWEEATKIGIEEAHKYQDFFNQNK